MEFFLGLLGFRPHPDMLRAMKNAHVDFFEGPLTWRTWASLGFYDIRLRYRRTFLGPLWITIGFAITFTMMAMLFSAVLKTDIRSFLPYVGAGMIIWTFASGIVTESPSIFISAHHIINSLKLPLSIHVLRCLCRHGMIFAHNFLAFILICAAIGHFPNANSLLLLATLPLLAIILYFMALILAIVGARFRDIAHIVLVATQLLFFMTPIIWSPSDLPAASKYWIVGNPFFHLLEIVRAPLIGKTIEPLSLIVTITMAILLALTSYSLFLVFRRRITYWL